MILPVTHQRFFLSYKGAAAFHGITDIYYGSNPGPDDTLYYRNLDQYIGSFNGLLLGTRFDIARSFYLEPMLGMGVLVHIVYGNGGEGIAYGSYETELSLLGMHAFEKLDLGGWLLLGWVPFGGYFDRWDVVFSSFGVAVGF